MAIKPEVITEYERLQSEIGEAEIDIENLQETILSLESQKFSNGDLLSLEARYQLIVSKDRYLVAQDKLKTAKSALQQFAEKISPQDFAELESLDAEDLYATPDLDPTLFDETEEISSSYTRSEIVRQYLIDQIHALKSETEELKKLVVEIQNTTIASENTDLIDDHKKLIESANITLEQNERAHVCWLDDLTTLEYQGIIPGDIEHLFPTESKHGGRGD